MKKKGIIALSMGLACLSSFVFAACGGGGGNDAVRHADADSVEILGTQSVLTPGEYTLEAKVKPAQADQGVRWMLVGESMRGVSVKDNVLTIGTNAEDDAKIVLRATSTFDTKVYVMREYTLDIPVIEGTPIRTEEELRAMDLNGSYILMNDIELTEPWIPVGTSELENDDGSLRRQPVPFNGVLNGNGYTISGIYYENESFEPDETGKVGEVTGFFEQIGGSGEVKNLGLRGEMKLLRWSGALAAINDGVISNCWTDVKLSCNGPSAAGLVSVNRGIVESCYAIGETTSKENNASRRSAALFVNAGTASMCFGDKDTMTTDNYQCLTAAIKNTEIMLSTAAMQTASTFAGWDTDVWALTNGKYPQLINADYVAEDEKPFISITTPAVNVEVKDLYDYQITVDVSGVEDRTVEFALEKSVAGVEIGKDTGIMTFDAETVEDYTPVTVVASLKAHPEVSAKLTFRLYNDDYEKTGIVRVKNIDDLRRIPTESKFLSRNIRLENDIDFGSDASWQGIGSETAPFTGSFDGNGHTISGFVMSGSANCGFFNKIQTAQKDDVAVKNLKLVGKITGSPSWSGGFVGAFDRGTIENCFADVDISTTEGLRIGGFVGVASQETATNRTVIKNCISVGKVSGGSCGGFAVVNHGTITNCYVDKTNSGTSAFAALGNMPADCAMYTDIEMRTAATFTNDMLADDVWHKQDASWPMLKYEGFTAPAPEKYIYIDLDGVIDVYTNPTYQLQLKEFPATAIPSGATFTMDTVTGVTLSESGLLTFTKDFVIGTTFTVAVEYDGVTATKAVGTTSSAPVAIGTEEELYALTQAGADLSRDYYLSADIRLDTYKAWPGIPTFTGTFDGRGHTISGLDSENGLFTTLEAKDKDTVIIKNLTLRGKMAGGAWKGGLGTWFNRGIVENCIIDLQYSAASGATGMVFGCLSPDGASDAATFRNSIILGSVDASSYGSSGWMKTIGAIAGAINGKVQNVFYDKELNGATAAMTNGTEVGGCNKTTAEMKQASLYSAFDADIWNITDGEYPTLKVQNS